MAEEDGTYKLLCEGINRMNSVNPLTAKGRLEFVLEHHPDIDPVRITAPPELQDLWRALSQSYYNEKFISGAKLIFCGALCDILAYAIIKSAPALEKMMPSQGELLSIATSASSHLLIIPGTACLALGSYFVTDGIMHWLEFRNEKMSKPLTERERTLANYVLMSEKH
jgi:hypothetical protein